MLIGRMLPKLRSWGDREAVIDRDGRRTTFLQLHAEIVRQRKNLEDLGITGGSVVALKGDYALETLACFWALALNRNIIMPLTANTPGNQERLQDWAEVEHVLSFDQGGAVKHQRRAVDRTHPLLKKLRGSKQAGMILFSSGSEGDPKIVLHSLDRLMTKYHPPYKPVRTLLFLVWDHIAGLDKMLYTIATGGCCIMIGSRNPEAISQAIARYKVESLSATPSFLRLWLMSGSYRDLDLSSLKIVTYGSEPMPSTLLESAVAAFPGVQFVNKFGMTELGSALSTPRSSDSPWIRFDPRHYKIKIVDGTMWVKSTTAMLGYLNAPDPFDRAGWLNTRDMVDVDGDWVLIKGRRNEMINVGGEKVYPSEIENVLLKMPGIADVSVWGEKNPILGQMIVAQVTPLKGSPIEDIKKEIRLFCRGKLAPYKVPAKIVVADGNQHNYRFKKMRRISAGR